MNGQQFVCNIAINRQNTKVWVYSVQGCLRFELTGCSLVSGCNVTMALITDHERQELSKMKRRGEGAGRWPHCRDLLHRCTHKQTNMNTSQPVVLKHEMEIA